MPTLTGGRHHGIRRITCEQRRQIHEGLEGGAGLAQRVRCPVELALLVTVPADDCLDRSVGSHADERRLRGIEGRRLGLELFIDDALRRLLQPEIGRGLHLDHIVALQALRFDQRQRFLIGIVQEIIRAVIEALADHPRRVAARRQQFAMADEPDVEHAVEHHIRPCQGLGIIRMRRIFGRCLEQAGQHGRFR